MWRWINSFWRWIWGWIHVTGWGLFLSGLSLLDLYHNFLCWILIIGGFILGCIGALLEHRIRKATSEGRAFNYKLRR